MGEHVDSHGLLLPWDHCGTSSAAVLRGDDPMLAPPSRSGQHPGRAEGRVGRPAYRGAGCRGTRSRVPGHRTPSVGTPSVWCRGAGCRTLGMSTSRPPTSGHEGPRTPTTGIIGPLGALTTDNAPPAPVPSDAELAFMQVVAPRGPAPRWEGHTLSVVSPPRGRRARGERPMGDRRKADEGGAPALGTAHQSTTRARRSSWSKALTRHPVNGTRSGLGRPPKRDNACRTAGTTIPARTWWVEKRRTT